MRLSIILSRCVSCQGPESDQDQTALSIHAVTLISAASLTAQSLIGLRSRSCCAPFYSQVP
ncbi:MAG: hypothetical protein LBF22_06635, partial [Deltaproteobacteria bacterium]|nr:hypothetical protein [Deltaproteobacteria bacterium]